MANYETSAKITSRSGRSKIVKVCKDWNPTDRDEVTKYITTLCMLLYSTKRTIINITYILAEIIIWHLQQEITLIQYSGAFRFELK